jgi:hypothetical protein
MGASANIDPNLTRRELLRKLDLCPYFTSHEEAQNESAPNSFESWGAKSNSPPPKSAHNHLTS